MLVVPMDINAIMLLSIIIVLTSIMIMCVKDYIASIFLGACKKMDTIKFSYCMLELLVLLCC